MMDPGQQARLSRSRTGAAAVLASELPSSTRVCRLADDLVDARPYPVGKCRHERGNARERLAWKVELVRRLYERGYEREDVLELFRFIDWLLVLPEEMTKSFRQRIEEIEQESKMKYKTSIERLARQEALREVILAQFEEKFGPPDGPIRRLVEKASQEQILVWAKKILTASSQDEIFAT